MADMEIGFIRIGYYLDPDGHPATSLEADGIDSIITQIGLLELAKDTLLRSADEDWEDDDE